MECIVVLFVLVLGGIGWLIEHIQNKNKGGSNKYYSSHSNFHYQVDNQNQKTLPNGYTRQDYYDYGYTDSDIEYWGLDQPSAPSPPVSGLVIADMMDGDFDGNIDWPF